MTRRELLCVGGLGLTGLTWPALLRGRAAALSSRQSKARSCIQLFLWGGPSQLETFDLKPRAPDHIRGAFQPIATRVPGTHICEHLPHLARLTDRYAIVRSVTHTGTNHGTSAYHMLTGHLHFSPGTLRHPTPNDYPSIGCAVAKFGRRSADLPGYVALPSVLFDGDGGEVPGQGPGLLGRRAAPFLVQGDPTRVDFSIKTLTLASDVDSRRLHDRMQLAAALDRQAEQLVRSPGPRAMDSYYEHAFRLLQSTAARQAFDLAAEPLRLRERYGWHHFGQSCLLARRLVEAGVPLITVYWNSPSLTSNQSWDTHDRSFVRLKDHLLPSFDRSMAALVEDLEARGLLADTLLVCHGEFGRTPKINKNAGRDHWGYCQSVLLAGAGVRGGQVYGASDASAAYAADSPVTPDDLAATIFTSLGIGLDHELQDAQGRPLPLCLGKALTGLLCP